MYHGDLMIGHGIGLKPSRATSRRSAGSFPPAHQVQAPAVTRKARPAGDLSGTGMSGASYVRPELSHIRFYKSNNELHDRLRVLAGAMNAGSDSKAMFREYMEIRRVLGITGPIPVIPSH